MQTFLKSILSTAALATFGLFVNAPSAQAQTGGLLTSGNAIMTVTLTDVLALAVTQPAVPLLFLTPDDYKNGKNVTIPLHLTVSSNRPYDIKVKSNGDLQSGLGETASIIPINNVSVQVDGTADMGTTPALNLTTSDQTLASNAPGAILKTVNVKYSTPANSTAFVKSGIYTATVVYSISAH